MQEIWKDIPQYEGRYKASSFGRIMSLNFKRTGKPCILNPRRNAKGYLKVLLPGGKNFYVHQLVAMAFLGHVPNGNTLEVDHIDGNIHNNKIENLREATKLQNNYNARISKRNKTGVKGVSWKQREQRYLAACSVKGKKYEIGYFKALEDAAKAVREFREKHHGEFARHT